VAGIALTLVDEKGVDALTLAAVADRAGVATPSLYKHIGSLADLRSVMAVKVLEQMTTVFREAATGRSRDDAVVALMYAYRAYVVQRPGRYALVPFDPLHDPATAAAGTELLGVLAAVLRGYGLDDSATVHAIRCLRAGAHGFASIEAAGGFGLGEDVEVSYRQLVDMLLRSFDPAGPR
jgi:AcrR family transcriptional regulator